MNISFLIQCLFFSFFLFSQSVSELISLKTAKATADVLVADAREIFTIWKISLLKLFSLSLLFTGIGRNASAVEISEVLVE